jgi:hypothetical protein
MEAIINQTINYQKQDTHHMKELLLIIILLASVSFTHGIVMRIECAHIIVHINNVVVFEFIHMHVQSLMYVDVFRRVGVVIQECRFFFFFLWSVCGVVFVPKSMMCCVFVHLCYLG